PMLATPEEIYRYADRKAREAVEKTVVRPMIVTQRENPLDDNSKVIYQEFVSDGPCGFAYVKVKPANCAFAKFLVKEGLARKWSGEPGVVMSIRGYNQSMQRKEAYAFAFSRVLSENNI